MAAWIVGCSAGTVITSESAWSDVSGVSVAGASVDGASVAGASVAGASVAGASVAVAVPGAAVAAVPSSLLLQLAIANVAATSAATNLNWTFTGVPLVEPWIVMPSP